jgi:4-amino-4-deoxy-L-arabinose transferase-like glycosyltransferase
MIDKLRQTPSAIGLLACVAFGLAIRLAAIDFQSLWRDEVDAIRFGQSLTDQIGAALAGGGLGGMIEQVRQTLTQPGFNGPAYFIALHGWTRLAGIGEFALRFFSAFFGVLAIPLTYTLARRLLRATHFRSASHVSLVAAWLVTVSPYFVWYSQEAKMYTEVTALALLAIYALCRAIDAREKLHLRALHRKSPVKCRVVRMRNGRRQRQRQANLAPYRYRARQQPSTTHTPLSQSWRWWVTLIVATTLAMYSHILAALLIGVEAALFLVWRSRAKQHWRGGLIALAALTLPYLPLVGWQLQLAFTPGSQGFAFYTFGEIARVLVAGFTHGVIPFESALSRLGIQLSQGTLDQALNPSGFGMWLTSALALLGALMWKDARDRSRRIGLATWVILPVAIIALISLNRPVFTDRYLIWIGPALYLLVALGIVEVWEWRKTIGVVALTLVTAIALVGVYAQSTTPFKSDFRSAARYVEAHRMDDEAMLFQIPYGRYTFDYYFAPPFRAIDGPYTNWPERNAASFDVEIAQSLEGQPAVWLIATEVEMWDNRRVLDDWLQRHGRATDRAEFMRVTVVRYELAR